MFELMQCFRVNFAYRCPRDSSDREYIAQVVRIDLLDLGQRGVDILLSSNGSLQ